MCAGWRIVDALRCRGGFRRARAAPTARLWIPASLVPEKSGSGNDAIGDGECIAEAMGDTGRMRPVLADSDKARSFSHFGESGHRARRGGDALPVRGEAV